MCRKQVGFRHLATQPDAPSGIPLVGLLALSAAAFHSSTNICPISKGLAPWGIGSLSVDVIQD